MIWASHCHVGAGFDRLCTMEHSENIVSKAFKGNVDEP